MSNHIIVSFTAVVALIASLLFLSFLWSLPVMLLWNGCLVGAVNGVNEVGWLQAWGLTFLVNLLFKPATTSKNT